MKLKLKANTRKPRVLDGHLWVFANELAEAPTPQMAGKGIQLEDAKGRLLGSGIVNPASQIVWRSYSKSMDSWDAAFVSRTLKTAIANRSPATCRRLVWSESDDLPGVVVDQFGDVLVIQILTLAAELLQDTIAGTLQSVLQPREIVFRNDAPSRQYEGLPSYVRTFSGAELEPYWLEIHGIQYFVDPASGQKTGFYLDQQYEHVRSRHWATGRTVLDACCNQGAFALNCAKFGATDVLALDISQDCVRLTDLNARRNNLPVRSIAANIFDFFTEQRGHKFDMIVLDPPSFARNKAAVQGAMRGYKELNLRAIRSLNAGGILATYSCSHHITRDLYLEMLCAAAKDSGRTVHVLEETMQPQDHPVRLGFPESSYLKGFWLKVL
ncbi:MAG: class I SAM-dependent rRNA methyltransferase [Verrucomicrobia bacterium]|nr:class I SAM-dependent rRNA methyltransferase [Verrucomicrobiota bacterium]